MSKRIFFLVAASAAIFAGTPASAISIVNGSFETGTNPGGGYLTLATGATDITGWTIAGFGVDYIGGYWQASDGVRSVDLSGASAGSISQTLATVIGTSYTVNFDMSGNPDNGTGGKVAVTSISGTLPVVSVYTVGATNTHANMNWQNYSYSFTAFDTLSTLVFASADYSPYGPAIDNVSILESGGAGSTVPEPAIWAAMTVGFGMVGASIRRRRSQASFAV